MENYINILTNDNTFTEFAIPNTIVYSVIVGVGGYILSFFHGVVSCADPQRATYGNGDHSVSSLHDGRRNAFYGLGGCFFWG